MEVVIRKFRTDNGAFNSKDFIEALFKSKQQVEFSRVGAPHQNSVAKHGNKTVVDVARTMMMHAAIMSPKLIMASFLANGYGSCCLVSQSHP